MTYLEGAAGLADYPTSLSPSRASDYMTCPLLFRFRSIDRLPQEPSPAALRGTMVHRALELIFDLPTKDRPERSDPLTRAILGRTLRCRTGVGCCAAHGVIARPRVDPD